MLLTFSGMVLGLGIDIMIASKLGASEASDALFVALGIPVFFDAILREGTKFSLVPVFLERQSCLEVMEYYDFVSSLLKSVLLFGVVLSLVLEMSAPLIIAGAGAGLSAAAKSEATNYLRILSPALIFSSASTILAVFLNSQKRFDLVAVRSLAVSAVVLPMILLGWESGHFLLLVSSGYLCGFALYNGILLLGARRTGWRFRLHAPGASENLKRLSASVTLPTLGFVLGQSMRIIERMLASLAGPGGVASYYFGFRIYSAIQTVIGTSVATSSLPDFSRNYLEGKKAKIAADLRRKIGKICLLTLPMVVILGFFHKPIISTIYGYGAFSGESTEITAQILLFQSFGMAFNCSIPILMAVLFAQQKYSLVFKNMLVAFFANLFLAFFLGRRFGLNGIAVALSVSALVGFLCGLYFVIRTDVNPLQRRSNKLTL